MKKGLRILFVAPRYHTNQHFTVKALIDEGHRVEFFAWMKGHSEEYSALMPHIFRHAKIFRLVERHLNPVKREKLSREYALPNLIELFKAIREFNPDAVIIRNPNYLFSFAALLVAKILGKIIIIYTQGPKYYSGIRKHLLKGLIVKGLRAAWITPVKGDPAKHKMTWPQIYYLPFIIPTMTPPSQKQWFRDGKINVLSIGKFVERKNHLLLLKALIDLEKEFDLRLTILGECTGEKHHVYYKKVRGLIVQNGLENDVVIRTNLPFQEVQKEYPRHDLFILPSRDEPAAVSPLEAMAHGLPMICSDTCGTRCYIEEGWNGYIFKTDDREDLVKKIRLCIGDKKRLVNMGTHSYWLVKSKHNPGKHCERLTRIINGSLHSRRL